MSTELSFHPGLIIFDCDGTLVDSEVLSNRVLVDVIADHGLTLSFGEALKSFRGAKMADCLQEIEKRLGRSLPDDFETNLRSRIAKVFETTLMPMDGAVEFVSEWHGPKCVASSGPRSKIEISLSLTGLLPYFQGHIFSAYEVGSWKPDPGLFLFAARAMGFSPAECLVVEDSLPGISAGLAAGMTVVAYQPHGADADLPDGVIQIEHFSELRELLSVNARKDASSVQCRKTQGSLNTRV